MQNPHGHIVSVRSDDTVIVEIDSVVACARCAAGKGCGAGLLGSQPGERRVAAKVVSNLTLHNGDQVSISLQPNNVLRAAIIVYGYPLLGAVAGAGVALTQAFGDVAAAGAALVGLVAGMLVARARLRGTRCLQDFTPVVIDRFSPDSH